MLYESRVQKIPLYKELDADFGTFFPTDVDSYISTVASKSHGYFDFLLLIPELDDDLVFKEIIDDIMLIFFEKGDKYKLRKITDEEITYYEKNKYITPILSFDPNTMINDKLGFFWLIPPKYLWQ